MPDKTETKPIRWRETKEGKPFGGEPTTYERVVEGFGPIPANGKATTDDPHDWEAVKENR